LARARSPRSKPGIRRNRALAIGAAVR